VRGAAGQDLPFCQPQSLGMPHKLSFVAQLAKNQ
jgi:hypothetical protein